MEKAKYSAFDLFGYALPGVYFLFGLFVIFNQNIKTLYDIPLSLQNFDLIQAIAALIIGYIMGFTFYRLGIVLRRIFGYRFWRDKKKFELTISETEKLILVREFCQENFKYIQTWFLISGMSANLALGSILLALASIVKMIQFEKHWVILLVVSIIMAFFQIEKSTMYIKWARRELNQAIITFNLQEKTLPTENQIMN